MPIIGSVHGWYIVAQWCLHFFAQKRDPGMRSSNGLSQGPHTGYILYVNDITGGGKGGGKKLSLTSRFHQSRVLEWYSTSNGLALARPMRASRTQAVREGKENDEEEECDGVEWWRVCFFLLLDLIPLLGSPAVFSMSALIIHCVTTDTYVRDARYSNADDL